LIAGTFEDCGLASRLWGSEFVARHSPKRAPRCPPRAPRSAMNHAKRLKMFETVRRPEDPSPDFYSVYGRYSCFCFFCASIPLKNNAKIYLSFCTAVQYEQITGHSLHKR
jgi:hypothetical protein